MTSLHCQQSESGEVVPPFDLDALEKRAAKAIHDTYDLQEGDQTARFWAQKGIEAMRLAVAEEKEQQLSAEHKDDAPGCPRGAGYRQVRWTTPWKTINPEGKEC